jgi:hypothetical protein
MPGTVNYEAKKSFIELDIGGPKNFFGEKILVVN